VCLVKFLKSVFLYCVLKRVFEEVEIEKCCQWGSYLKSIVCGVYRRKLFGKLFGVSKKQKFGKCFFRQKIRTTYVLLRWPHYHP
jgi:hypothetical protein